MKDKCTLPNEELIQLCQDWVSSLAKTGGDSWTLQVPVNFDKDPDMLFCELINRFKALADPSLLPDESALQDEAEGLYPYVRNAYAETVKEHSENDSIGMERAAYIKGRRKTIEAMDAEIENLKEQLRVKEFFLRKAYDDLNIKNELLTKRDEQIEALKDEPSLLLTTLQSIKQCCEATGKPMDLVLQSIWNQADKAEREYNETKK
jgi:hypothetical protein